MRVMSACVSENPSVKRVHACAHVRTRGCVCPRLGVFLSFAVVASTLFFLHPAKTQHTAVNEREKEREGESDRVV